MLRTKYKSWNKIAATSRSIPLYINARQILDKELPETRRLVDQIIKSQFVRHKDQISESKGKNSLQDSFVNSVC